MANNYRIVEADLLFFFNNAEASVGFKSGHGAFVASLYGTTATRIDPDPYTDGMLKSIHKIRCIRATLHGLDSQTRRVLSAVYDQQYRYPPELAVIYGYKAGAVLFNSYISDLDRLVRLCRRKIASKLTDNDAVLMFQIGVETRQLFDRVHTLYLAQRKKCF